MDLQANGFDWDRGNRASARNMGFLSPPLNRFSLDRWPFCPTRPIRKVSAVFVPSAERTKDAACSSFSRFGIGAMRSLAGPSAPGICTRERSMPSKKKIPAFKTDRAAAAFVDAADLSLYDLSGAQLMRFEIKRKGKSINLRLSEELYNAVRKRAARAGLPYQRFIRLMLEQAVSMPR
jgi:predicted DNA binding CopG/RHH family protein